MIAVDLLPEDGAREAIVSAHLDVAHLLMTTMTEATEGALLHGTMDHRHRGDTIPTHTILADRHHYLFEAMEIHMRGAAIRTVGPEALHAIAIPVVMVATTTDDTRGTPRISND